MNENFNNINWDEINEPDIHEEMLFAIRNLASNDEEIRSECLWNLFDCIWHQGTLSPRAAFAVPFLIARLHQETEPGILVNILYVLASLATGDSYHDINPGLRDNAERNTVEFQERMEEGLNDVKATYTAVYKGINVYLNLLEHESKDVRIAAACVLSCYKQDLAKICSNFYAKFDRESDELVKAAIPLCLAYLSKSTPVQIAFFKETLNSNESDIVKLSAGISLAYIAGEHMSNSALDTLTDKLQNPNLLNKLYDNFENQLVDFYYLSILDFFSSLNHQQLARVIPVLLQVKTNCYGLDDLFELVFNNRIIPEGSFFQDLSDTEQLIIKAVIEDDSLHNVSYMGGFLDKLGGDGLVIKQKLVGFINGEGLKYDR
ncbi:hypothetical protein NIES267_28980 [Calothrix parasitica NIES-267]|uniref:HEAT repeat-containing PBS lyase n=1 Tax=Calothrix parasitica NIES-267 TaxID=1973488 RepID=A0A1Z4LQ91_9CYAN|nr:hypothetical protein NIES267_28980 [Calothrix parasitica NIES-267]